MFSKVLVLSGAAYDRIIRIGCDTVDQCIKYGKDENGNSGRHEKQLHIHHIEQRQQLLHHRKRKGKMHHCRCQRQEEYGKHLGINAPSDIFLSHSYLLHDLKSGLVFIALGNLFIIDDQDCRKKEYDTQ